MGAWCVPVPGSRGLGSADRPTTRPYVCVFFVMTAVSDGVLLFLMIGDVVLRLVGKQRELINVFDPSLVWVSTVMLMV